MRECNRKACRAPLPSPRWWNTSTRAYYCDDCKGAITRWPENVGIFEDRTPPLTRAGRMRDTIWVVRDPSGNVIGASARGGGAAIDEVPLSEMSREVQRSLFIDVVNDPSGARYEQDGYTLTREALAAETRVRVLDEWRVLMHCGDMVDGGECFREAYAHTIRKQMDENFSFNAPHRVVRVALVLEED